MKESILPYLPSGVDFKLPSVPRPKKGKRNKSRIKMGRGPGVIGSDAGIAGIGGDGGGAAAGEAIEESVKKKDFTYTYSCAMLNISDEVAPIFTYWAKRIIPPKNVFINLAQGMEGYEDTPHTTIKYGLHDETPEKVAELSKKFGIIQLNFGKITKFTINPDFDVLKVDVISEKLMELNKLISSNMESTDKYTYIPHVTLAYIKKGTCDDLVGNDFFCGLNDFVNEIYFTSRTGEDFFISLI
jgi:hypothetical protein